MDILQPSGEFPVARREVQTRPLRNWDDMKQGMTVEWADEAGAILHDAAEGRWYLDINAMQYRDARADDVFAERGVEFLPLSVEKGHEFANGATAAMELRRRALEKQIVVLEMVGEQSERSKPNADMMLEGIQEELQLVRQYLAATPDMKDACAKLLTELYEDMRADDPMTDEVLM